MLPSLKLTVRPWEMLVGKLLSFWGRTSFQGRAVSFREGMNLKCSIHIRIQVVSNTKSRQHWKWTWHKWVKVASSSSLPRRVVIFIKSLDAWKKSWKISSARFLLEKNCSILHEFPMSGYKYLVLTIEVVLNQFLQAACDCQQEFSPNLCFEWTPRSCNLSCNFIQAAGDSIFGHSSSTTLAFTMRSPVYAAAERAKLCP